MVVDFLREANTAHPADQEILWRLSRACYKLSEALEDKAASKAACAESLALAKAALGAVGGDANYKCHLYYGITLNGDSGKKGTKTQLQVCVC